MRVPAKTKANQTKGKWPPKVALLYQYIYIDIDIFFFYFILFITYHVLGTNGGADKRVAHQ